MNNQRMQTQNSIGRSSQSTVSGGAAASQTVWDLCVKAINNNVDPLTLTTNNRPILTRRSGKINAAVWAKARQLKAGSIIPSFSIKISKSWFDKSTNRYNEVGMSLFPEDLDDLILILQEVRAQTTVRTF